MGKLAVVLSGGWARTAGHLGALLALEEAGIKPDVIVGTAGGALVGGLYLANDGQAGKAKDEYYQVAEHHSWQDLADIDFSTLLRALEQPSDLSGLMQGQTLFNVLREKTSIGQRGFQHLEGELFVLTSDLTTGHECVFCGHLQEELFPGDPPAFELFAQAESNLNEANVATAVWASMLVPPLFRTLPLRGKALACGELLLRRAIQLALALPEVDRVLVHHVGYASKLRDDFSQLGLGVLTLESHALAAEQQFLGLLDLGGKADAAVRLLEPGLSNISEVDLAKTQELVESTRRTMAAILAKGDLFGNPDELAGRLQEEEARWATQTSGGTLLICDRKAPAVEEMAWDFEEYLEERGEPRLRERWPISTSEWLWEEACDQEGGRLWGLLLKKWIRLSYDYVTLSFKELFAVPSIQRILRTVDERMANATLWFLDSVIGPLRRGRT